MTVRRAVLRLAVHCHGTLKLHPPPLLHRPLLWLPAADRAQAILEDDEITIRKRKRIHVGPPARFARVAADRLAAAQLPLRTLDDLAGRAAPELVHAAFTAIP